MSVLKVVSVSLLGFLLTLSLIIFGLAFTVQMTALNADFVTSRIDALDVSALTEEIIDEQVSKGDFPEEFTGEIRIALVDTIDKLEPLIKEQLDASVYSIYDYLLAKKENPELALTLRETFLNSEFVDLLLNEIDIPSLLEDVDLSSLAMDFINEQTSEDIPEEAEYLVGHVDEIIIELEPWMREQAGIVADPVFDYLLGISQNINLSVSLEPVKDALGDNLKEIFLESPPAELAGLSQTELDQYFDEHFGELAEELPSTFDLDESVLGDLRTDITGALADAETAFGESREYIGQFTLGYNLLIVFILLLTAGIVLIHREVKGSTRTLAGIFITFGVVNLVAVLVARALIRPPLEQIEDIQSSLLEWIVQTANSSLTPLLVMAIVLLVVGAALLAFSIIYSRRQARMAAGHPYSSTQEDEPSP